MDQFTAHRLRRDAVWRRQVQRDRPGARPGGAGILPGDERRSGRDAVTCARSRDNGIPMTKLIIAGELRDASDGGVTEIRNPATGELVQRVAAATQQDVDDASDAADAARRKWSSLSPPQRAEILYKAGRLLRERENELARLLTQE